MPAVKPRHRGSGACEILLASEIDLHAGVHGALRDCPPTGFTYRTVRGRHVFLAPPARAGMLSPARHRHWGEFLDVGRGREVVHSARWPVLHRRSWVADMDDLAYPLLTGRTSLNPRFRRDFRRPWSRALERDLRLRAAHMLLAYADPSCHAILFRTERGVRDATATMQALGIESLGDTFLAKSRVVYPAVPAVPFADVRRKWESPHPRRVVFCGRDFEGKEGPLALRVLERLFARSSSVRATFIGPVPDAWRRQHAATVARLDHMPALPRAEVLRRFRDAHILFHPARRENVGMVFLEAAAAGMAVVASEGAGTAQLAEIVNPAGVALVQRDTGCDREHENRFVSALERLTHDRATPYAMGRANHDWAMSGRTSVETRDRALTEVYGAALARPARRPLAIGSVCFTGSPRVASMTSDKVVSDEVAYYAATGMQGKNIYF